MIAWLAVMSWMQFLGLIFLWILGGIFVGLIVDDPVNSPVCICITICLAIIIVLWKTIV